MCPFFRIGVSVRLVCFYGSFGSGYNVSQGFLVYLEVVLKHEGRVVFHAAVLGCARCAVGASSNVCWLEGGGVGLRWWAPAVTFGPFLGS